MSTPQTSAQVLHRFWAAHVARCRRRGESVPKRSDVSRALSRDRNLLSRWMNPRVAGWRLPIGQVTALADKLNLTREERDELMAAVVHERMQDESGAELAVLSRWLFDMYEGQFTPSEQQVLAAWRKAAAPFGTGLAGDDEENEMLAAAFERILRSAAAKHQRAAQAALEDARSNLMVSPVASERPAPDPERLRLAVQGGAFRAKHAAKQMLAEALKAQPEPHVGTGTPGTTCKEDAGTAN